VGTALIAVGIVIIVAVLLVLTGKAKNGKLINFSLFIQPWRIFVEGVR
jgi:hypothetical protein